VQRGGWEAPVVTWSLFLQTLVGGISIGCIYALAGISINVMYRPGGYFNFAQGYVVLLGSILMVVLFTEWGWNWYVAALAIMVLGGILGGATELVAIRPIMRRRSSSVAWVITTLAVSLLLSNEIGARYQGTSATVSAPPGLSTSTFTLGSALISSYDIGLLVFVCLVPAALWFLYRTRHGLAVRALAEDRDAALLRGVPANALTSISWMLGGALGMLAGVLDAPLSSPDVTLGFTILISGFLAVAIGGLGDNRGAIIGGLLLGCVQSFAAIEINPSYQNVAAFIVFLIILALRPRGIFGAPVLREV
jgi:branched-chain amino acid transport system permease protein